MSPKRVKVTYSAPKCCLAKVAAQGSEGLNMFFVSLGGLVLGSSE